MFDHVTLRVSDRQASVRFYETVLETLGIPKTSSGAVGAEWDDFSLAPADATAPATRPLHLGFGAPSRGHVDRFWRAGIDSGHRDDGRPGPRPEYRGDYYGGFLLDPDGNSTEAVEAPLREDRAVRGVPPAARPGRESPVRRRVRVVLGRPRR